MPAFTDSIVKGLKPTDRQFEVFEGTRERNTGRLGIRVTKTGTKAFIYRYFVNGKPRFITIGRYHPKAAHNPEAGVSLREVKAKQSQFAKMLGEGLDPKTQLEQQKLTEEKARLE